MKVLIVDDSANAARRIEGMLSAAGDMKFLILSDGKFARDLALFGVVADVALVDLRLTTSGSEVEGDYEGLSVCQTIRHAMPDAVIVGYSSSFNLESEQNLEFQKRFSDMGADIVCALDHLTLTPVSELRFEFEEARAARAGTRSRSEKKRIFVGSSTEGLAAARKVQAKLSPDFDVVLWNETVFGLGTVTVEALEKAVRDFEYAVFVFTPDDERKSRGERKLVARDNVIFEAGLFVGSIGRSRAYILAQRSVDIVLPSDLAGLTVGWFDGDPDRLNSALGPACEQIRAAIDAVSSGIVLRAPRKPAK